jgi:hypothetical protein
MSSMLINTDLTLEQEMQAIEASLPDPTVKRKRRADPEGQVQRAIIKACALVGVMAVHVPNEAKRSLRGHQKAKRDGMVKGFPDLLIYGQGAMKRHALFEVKAPAWKAPRAPKIGQTPTEAWHEWAIRLRLYEDLRRRGFEVEVVQSVDDALRYLRGWGWVLSSGEARK